MLVKQIIPLLLSFTKYPNFTYPFHAVIDPNATEDDVFTNYCFARTIEEAQKRLFGMDITVYEQTTGSPITLGPPDDITTLELE
jgi:hypothetical protein